MLDNNKCMLVYGAGSNELENLAKLGIKVIEITPEMTQMTLEEILEGFRFKTFNPSPIKAKIVILNSFSDNEIKQSIRGIRDIMDDTILAVPTPANIKWKFDKLAEHLVEERNWHLNNQKGR